MTSISTASTESVQSTPSPSSVVEGTTSTSSSTVVESTPSSEAEIRAKAQEIVANDLKTWQQKFAKAADEGSDELEQRMTEVTEKLVQGQAQGVGKALTIQLEETVKSSLKNLKSSVNSIIKNNEDIEESEEEISTAVRKAGMAIKDKAQAVRTWRKNFDEETNSLVSQAASDTFEILDYIRDMGLQEIGMRWAWTDGITHKDWTKYHKLKGNFDHWRGDVERVVTEHSGIRYARAASQEVEGKAMDIAEEAAKELASLKETARWKLSAGDASDDWSPKCLPAAAVKAGQSIKQKISKAQEAVAPSKQGTVESIVSKATASAADAASSASSIAASVSGSIVGTQGTVESVMSAASSSASSLANDASSAVIGTQQGTVASVISAASSSASSLANDASSAVIGTQQGSVESIVSVATESASSLSAKASASIVGEEPGMAEKATAGIKSAASAVSSSASKASSSVSSATSSIASSLSKSVTDASSSASSVASSVSGTASKKVWGGAMAQHVEAREIVFEDVVDDSDEDTFSEKVQSMASEAGDKYADITRAVSEALLKPSTTAGYQVTELAAQKYSSALAAASTALYGAEKGTGEVVASAAASRYADAVSA
jgi:hypothetical protein